MITSYCCLKANNIHHFVKSDGLEISSKEDIEDLKILKSTRNEETVSFKNYLKNDTLR